MLKHPGVKDGGWDAVKQQMIMNIFKSHDATLGLY